MDIRKIGGRNPMAEQKFFFLHRVQLPTHWVSGTKRLRREANQLPQSVTAV